jgi:group I intron endonuclease
VDTIPHSSGVYQIRCVPTGKVYVGSAADLYVRWYNHQNELTRNQHHNQILQRAWKKYGADAFVFEVLEFTSISDLIACEQRWIDATTCCDRAKGYNILPHARSARGMKMPQDVIERVRRANSKTWIGFIDPHGNEVDPITNLRAFCQEHGLSQSAMQHLGKNHPYFKSHKGWTHKDSSPRRPKSEPPRVDNAKVWEGFIDPDGNSVRPITNLPAFCREHGLTAENMRALAAGRRQSHRGWTHVHALPYKTKPHKGRS